MIFKTITDETTLSGQRIVGALQARKIAQQQATAQLEIDIACLKEYQVACQNGTVTTEQFDAIMHKASASAVEYSAKVKAGTGTAQSYANAQRATNSALQEVSIGAGIASKAVKLFSVALNMIAFTAIIQGVSWLIGKVDEWIVTAKEAKESADAFKESLSTFFNETQTNLKTISSLSDRFNELSKNVDDTGKKIGGTEEEYAEFLDICQQVGQIMPELITGYTNEGEAIITLQGKVDGLTDSYKEAIKAKAALFISKGDEEGNTIESFFEDYDNFINGTQKGWFSFSPSPQFSKTTKYEEYYGYDKIHEWLSNVNGKTLEELNKQIKSTTGQIQNVYLRKVLEEAEFDINNITEENYNAVHDVLNNKLIVMEKELSDRVINIRSAFQNMLYADSDYWNIDDENVLSAINSLYGSIDAEFIKNNELFSQKALQTFESDFVSLFNNDATKQAMVDFYTPIADDETVKDYADRIKSSLETVQSYCNEHGITIPINFNDSEQTINNLEAQYQRAVDFAKDKFDGYNPTEFFKEHSINTQEEIDAWQGIAQGARSAIEAKMEYLNQDTGNSSSTTFTAFTEEQSKSIDDFQSKVKTLGDALSSLQSGDTIELTDLIQEFPELANQSDNLEQAIQQLIYNALQELYDTLGQGLPTDVKDDLQAIADEASGVAPDLNTAFASIQKSYDAMHEFKDAMDTDGLTESILSNVGALSSYMNQLVAQFHSGTISADQLYQALTEHYGNDLKNYGNALIAKNLYSEDFYNAVGLSSTKVINQFNKNYGIDIQNCKDYNQAKLRIEQKTLGKISEIWSKYYDSQSMTYKPAMDILKQSAMNGNAQAQKDYALVMQYTTSHTNAMNELNKIIYEGLDTSFDEISHDTGGNGKGSSSKKDKETIETFDFIETTIKRIEAAIDKVKSKAEDTFRSFSSRSKSYAETIKKMTDEIALQEQAKQKYIERRDSIGLDEYWAAQVRDGSLNIADITDDALKEQINAYGEWNDKVIECTESISDLKKEQKELVRESIELLITKYGKLETKASNAAGKVQDRIDLKEAWGGSAKASDYNSMNKSVAKQVGYLEKQNTELKKLQKSVPRTSEAWYDYQEQIDSNSSSIQDLTKSMAENAQAAASLAKTKADLKVDKYDSKDELYNAKIENATTAKSKNSLIDNEISNIGNRQKAYKTAVKTSTKKLNSSASAINGLKSKKTNTNSKATNAENKTYNTVLKKVKAKVKKGERIGTSLLNKATGLNDDLALYNACVQYNAYLDAKEENETIAELYAETAKLEKNALALQKFNNVAAEYGNKIQMSDYQMTALDNKISETETAGKKVERSYYDTQKKINAEKLAQYQAEKSALEESIKGIKQGTDEWYEAYDQIQDVSSSISDCVKETYELNNAINQLHFDQFNDVSESIGRIITEQEFLRGLFAHEKNTDTKTGNFTDAGFANLGSLSASYYASKERAENDGIELQKLKAILDKGANADGTYGDADLTFNSLEDLQKEIDKTYTTWQNDIKETYSVESEIADLMKEKYQAELDMLQELINAKKEALQSEKDLHDYQKTLNEKTKDITTIQKQIAAYSGDSSEEAMAKLQKLQKELAEKEEDLRETEYDRYISDQEDMLNKLYEEYEELVTKKLEDFMTLVKEGLTTANNNLSLIDDYLSRVADSNGYIEETKGLFDGLANGISGNVDRIIAAITSGTASGDGTGQIKNDSQTSPTKSGNSSNVLPSLSGAKPSIIEPIPERRPSMTLFDSAKSYIKKNVIKAEKAKGKYSAVNQKIYDNRADAYKGNGKILPSSKLEGLAEKLGVAYNGGEKDGRLYKKLKEIKFPGFKKGGIVSVDDIEKQVHDNGDDGIVSVKNGEGILTQKQTEALEKFTEKLPEKDGIIRTPDGVELTPVSPEDFIKMLQARSADKQTPDLGGMAKPDLQDLSGFMKPILPDLSGMVKFEPPEVPSAGNMNNVVNIDTVSLPNVTNYQEFKSQMLHDIQTEKKTGMLLRDVVGVSQLVGGGKLDKFRHKF